MEKQIVVTQDRLEKVSERFITLINQSQSEGYTVDEVVCAMLYMAGATIKQRGAELFCDKPLREALPPVVAGYEAAEWAGVWQLEKMHEMRKRSVV